MKGYHPKHPSGEGDDSEETVADVSTHSCHQEPWRGGCASVAPRVEARVLSRLAPPPGCCAR